MKILILGSKGQLGNELTRSMSVFKNVKSLSKYELNLNNLDKVSEIIRNFVPDVIINASAYTNVDKAKSCYKEANKVNSDSVGFLAKESKSIGSLLIHYSTDYVFDGKSRYPYTETDITNPLNEYGRSKLNGEKLIINSGCKYFIFRISWLYSILGNNFPKTILNLAREKEKLKIVSDQIGAPTNAELIADVTASILCKIIKLDNINNLSGIYNLTAKGETSWFEFTKFLINEYLELGSNEIISPSKIYPIKSKDYSFIENRPLNSRLNVDKICNTFNISLPHWTLHAKRFIYQLCKLEEYLIK